MGFLSKFIEALNTPVTPSNSKSLFTEDVAQKIWHCCKIPEIVFPDVLNNGQTLYKAYSSLKIEYIISKKDFLSLVCGEPLYFAKEQTNNRIAIYQKNLKIGYVNEKGEKMTREFLDRNDIVVGFFSYIYAEKKEARAHIAYYRDKSNSASTYDLSGVLEEIKLKAYIKVDTTPDKGEIKIPLKIDNKTLYCIDTRYNIYIVKEPKFGKLKVAQDLILAQEPGNTADPQAVMVLQKSEKLGYMYKESRDLANIAIQNKNHIIAKLVLLQPDEQIRLRMVYAFYM